VPIARRAQPLEITVNMPEEPPSAQEPVRPLSPRELAILRRLTTGATNKEIARDLGIAETTVYAHLKNLFLKLGVQNRTEAALWASHHGIRNT
jgi:two-component system nitrate/nitrite response regulator NarL